MTKVVHVALYEDSDKRQWNFQFINHYLQGDSGPKPKMIELIGQLLSTDSSWPSPWFLVRPPNSAPIIIFWSCSSIASLNQLPSLVGIPCHSASPRNLSRAQVQILQHWKGFQPSRKMVFLARWIGWWWDRQNDSLLSLTRRRNDHWSDVLARRACAHHAKTPRWAITHVELLCKLHKAPSFALDGLDKASSWAPGRRKLQVWQIPGLVLCCLPPDGS